MSCLKHRQTCGRCKWDDIDQSAKSFFVGLMIGMTGMALGLSAFMVWYLQP